METEKKLRKQVEHYVEEIVNKSLEIVMNATYGNRQLNRNTVSKVHKKVNDVNLSNGDTNVKQFAECLVDESFKEGLEEVDKLSKIKPILCVGIVTLDFVTISEEYPAEDSKTIAVGNYWSRGGNAANTATVLAHLGARVEYFGTIVNNRWMSLLQDDFKNNGVSTEHCIYLDHEKHKAPVATLITSQKTGTRTVIADFKGITGVTYEQFSSLNIGKYGLIHLESRSFEGRAGDIADIIALIVKHNETNVESEKIVISVEIEQSNITNPEFRSLFAQGDIVLIGKDYAIDDGYTSKEEAVRGLYKYCKPDAILVCAWGDDGAAAMFDEQLVCSPAITPEKLVDTLGEGDTFNAGFIYAFSRGKSVAKAVKFGCMVAGHKCGCNGFSCVKGMQRNMYQI
ncbi:ketohexokinase-like [Mercenaria mercenaria]|uniref:ketohexokinase-like n=1 Tax=Mercenaria mercenaria TaxID=6596 RepID=UPI00234F66A5|nr:ketohexokinase-like [Mercenaria mercenaria]